MIRRLALVLLIPILFWGCETSQEKDVHYSMGYIDAGQVSVPPEAISPYEPTDVTYLYEPSVELSSDWNLDVKLYSKYRYTNEYVERWRKKMGYTPTRPIMTNEEFFNEVNLNYPGLEEVKMAIDDKNFSRAQEEYLVYQSKRSMTNHLKLKTISKKAGEVAVKEADRIMADPKFPDCFPGKDFSLIRLSGHLDRAYFYTKETKYAKAWLEVYNFWYEKERPPAERLKAYIGFIFEPNWITLEAWRSVVELCESERRLASTAGDLGLDKDKLFNIYKSILEHAQFLYLNNDVFMPGNWQVHQCEGMIKIGAYYPTFKQAPLWCDHSWKLILEHMETETYADGTHSENAIGYTMGTVAANRKIVRYVRKLGLNIPEEFLQKWRSMYMAGTKIITPSNSGVPIGDGGIGPDGYMVRRLLIEGVLEFPDPTMKYFTEQYPEDVIKIAEEKFENTDEVLAAYNKIKSKKPSFTSAYLPDSDWAMMRQSWEKKSHYLFFDGGSDESWHAHPDFGTFNIWAYGKPIITDCGRTGPYEADMSKRWYKQTIAQNTVMVDSRSMRKCVDNHITQWWTGENYDFVDAMSDGYRWIGVLHNRRILFVKPDYWIVSDFMPGPSYYNSSFQTTGYHEFDWLAHFQPTKLRIDEDTKRIYTTNEDANIALVPLNADEVQVKESKGPTGTPTGMVETPYISLHQEGMAFVQYQVLLLPYEGKDAPQIDIMKLVADKADRVHRQNIGYKIDVSGRKDVFLESSNTEELASYGDYKFRGAVAHISDAEKSNPQYLLLHADRLSKNGKLLFSAPNLIEAVEFTTPKPSELKIQTESDIAGIKIYAPGVRKVQVNNKDQKFTKKGDYIIIK